MEIDEKTLVWYSESLEIMGPLRWHLSELVELCEQYNRFAKFYNKLDGKVIDLDILNEDKIKVAKEHNEKVNNFFSHQK